MNAYQKTLHTPKVLDTTISFLKQTHLLFKIFIEEGQRIKSTVNRFHCGIHALMNTATSGKWEKENNVITQNRSSLGMSTVFKEGGGAPGDMQL